MNLLQNLPKDLQEEIFDTILETQDITLERIVSKGHTTPEGEWYDQNRHEWVLILAGSATILFADGREVKLQEGDHLIIPAHSRHRVTETDKGTETIWLALHYMD